MLDTTLKAQLKTYLERITLPVELVASLDDSAAASQMRALLEDIAALHPRVSARFDGDDADHARPAGAAGGRDHDEPFGERKDTARRRGRSHRRQG